jgi:6-phosphogluconolactonase
MARRELVDHVPVRFIAPDTTLEDPAIAAGIYETILSDELVNGPDVVLLGIGDDGHTASLFPGTDAVAVDRPGYVANWVPRLDTWRLTATIPLLQQAANIVFLVSGAAKAGVLRRILVDDEPFPAGLVSSGAADGTWLLDAAAASKL